MKIKLLKKVRSTARCFCSSRLSGWTITNGELTGIIYRADSRWAFAWMIGTRLNPGERSDMEKIERRVARHLWDRELRDKWARKLGRSGVPTQEGGAK